MVGDDRYRRHQPGRVKYFKPIGLRHHARSWTVWAVTLGNKSTTRGRSRLTSNHRELNRKSRCDTEWPMSVPSASPMKKASLSLHVVTLSLRTRGSTGFRMKADLERARAGAEADHWRRSRWCAGSVESHPRRARQDPSACSAASDGQAAALEGDDRSLSPNGEARARALVATIRNAARSETFRGRPGADTPVVLGGTEEERAGNRRVINQSSLTARERGASPPRRCGYV